MVGSKIICNNCDMEITEYFHEGYKGKRGKCSKYGADVPLE